MTTYCHLIRFHQMRRIAANVAKLADHRTEVATSGAKAGQFNDCTVPNNGPLGPPSGCESVTKRETLAIIIVEGDGGWRVRWRADPPVFHVQFIR